VANSAAIVDVLRNARGTDDTLTKLRAESLEARRERIVEAAAKSDWAGGPAEVVSTYTHHALLDKNGTLMRVHVNEDKSGKITFDKPEVFHIPMPTSDVGREVMETAKAAVDKIIDGKLDEARPMVAGIANALHTSGDLKRQITTEIAKRSIMRDAWWHSVVGEHMEKLGVKVENALDNPADSESLVRAMDALQASLVEAARTVSASVKRLDERSDVPEAIKAAATDITADLKYAIQALSGVSREDNGEMQGVYEGVGAVAGQLRLGAAFLASLVPDKETKTNDAP
jgi:hypothetical protein